MRIIYFPLEAYKERYTCQLSKRKTGWLESRWLSEDIVVSRIEGNVPAKTFISTGSVLDAIRRPQYACSQVIEYLKFLDGEVLYGDDVLYFDDFFHPGIESIAYAHHLMLNSNPHYQKYGVPKMYALLHAQSVDIYDFTYPMRNWMRYYEHMCGEILDGIFVSCNLLRYLVNKAGIGYPRKVHVTGLPYNSEEVRTHFPKEKPKKKNQVVFSSRWDTEKCPEFFLSAVHYLSESNIKFVITTSQEKLRSNDTNLLKKLQKSLELCPNLALRENQSKEQYYETLLESKIQFNCANQDFISWTLLEALTCECIPVYPNFRSFPEVLPNEYLYNHYNIYSACDMILEKIEKEYPHSLDKVYKEQDQSWIKMLNVMEEY